MDGGHPHRLLNIRFFENRSSIMKPNLHPETPLLESTLTVMEELASVMQEEWQTLQRQDLAGIAAIAQRKGKLVMAYQANMKAIAAEPSLLAQASAAMRAKLKTAGQKLAEIGVKNAQALQAATAATQELVRTLIGLVKEEALPKQGYSDPRTAHLALGVYSPTCQPVAVNRQI